MSKLVQEAREFIKTLTWIAQKENPNNYIDEKVYISLIDNEMDKYKDPSNIYYSGLDKKFQDAELKKRLQEILIKYRAVHLPTFHKTTINEVEAYESGESLEIYKKKNNIRTLASYEAVVADLTNQLNALG